MSTINFTLDIYNIIVSIIYFLAVIFRNHLSDKIQGHFKYLLIFNFLISVSNIGVVLFEGTAKAANLTLYPIALFIFHAAYIAMVISAFLELIYYVDQKPYLKFVYGSLIFISIAFYVILILTPFTGLLYEIDANNCYKRGAYFAVPFFLEFLLFLVFIFYTSINRRKVNSIKYIAITFFTVVPLIAQIIEIAVPGIVLYSSGFSIVIMTMFIFSQKYLEQTLDNIEIELNQKEIDLINKVHEAQNTKLEVIKMQDHTIESLSNLVENRDEDTGEHVRRTRAYVELIAVQLMKNNHFPDILNARYVRFLKRAAPMHDIGKIVVPDAVLKKPGRFTDDEFELMKRHASEGGRIVHEILDGYEDPEYIKMTADIATHHHEKWDGTGYPAQLKGEEIPLCARIMALADVFDALVSPRVYKSPMTYEEAYSIIESGIGTHFDPIIAQEFLNIKEKTAAVNESFKINN